MKVKITADAKKYLTMEEGAAARDIIQYFRNDAFTAKDYAEMACRAIYGMCERVYDADAEICRNSRAYNRMNDESGYLDVWIRFAAKVGFDLYVEGGACVTDIWDVLAETGKNPALEEHSYRKEYRAAK